MLLRLNEFRVLRAIAVHLPCTWGCIILIFWRYTCRKLCVVFQTVSQIKQCSERVGGELCVALLALLVHGRPLRHHKLRAYLLQNEGTSLAFGKSALWHVCAPVGSAHRTHFVHFLSQCSLLNSLVVLVSCVLTCSCVRVALVLFIVISDTCSVSSYVDRRRFGVRSYSNSHFCLPKVTCFIS